MLLQKQFIGFPDIWYQLTIRQVGDTSTVTMYSGDIIFVYRATSARITTTA